MAGLTFGDDGSRSVAIDFARGTYAVRVVVNGVDATPKFVVPLAHQQYALLAP